MVFALYTYFKGGKENYSGDLLISTAFYALLYAFYSNKKKLNLKYVLALPMSKAELLITKSVSDLIFFIPAIGLAFVGVFGLGLKFSAPALAVILVLVVVIVSLIMFDSDIEQPRLENTRASFINRLIYARKAINFFFFATLATYIGIGIYFSPLKMEVKQYGVILLLLFVLILKFNSSLKLMKDESLSYFMFKRDLWYIGLKVSVFILPVILLKVLNVSSINISPYGDQAVFNMIRSNNLDDLELALKEKDLKGLVGRNGVSPIYASIREGRVKILELLLKYGHKIDQLENIEKHLVDKKYTGLKASHLSVLSENIEMFQKVRELENFSLEEKTLKTYKSLLTVSSEHCSEEIADYLIEEGVDLNHQDSNGKTALMYAVENGCDSIAALLVQAKANVELKDLNQKTASDYAKKGYRLKYYLERSLKKQTNKLPLESLAKESNQKSKENLSNEAKRSPASDSK